MHRLLYVSSATSQMSEDDLQKLLEQCRRNNIRYGVSGLLLYADGNFIQVLEGKEEKIDLIYDAIVHDPRNSGHILLYREQITKRAFPEWGMGFKVVAKETVKDLLGYSDFLNDGLPLQVAANQSETIVKILHHFRESCA